MSTLFARKDIKQLVESLADENAQDGHGGGGELKRHLGAFNLTMLGIGAIIGAGIFTLTGSAAANYAGPGIVYSFIIGGILCACAGLCYAEMASMIPVAGSAYAYSYATLGELIAWIIGWDLVLEYAFGAVTVATAWSGYLYSLLHKTLGIEFADSFLRLTKGPLETVTLASGQEVSGLWNVPATLVALGVSAVLYRGIKESARVNNFIVVLKVAIVVAFIALGIGVISASNLNANPGAGFFGSLVPPEATILENGKEVTRYGWFGHGVITAAGVVFFAYIGFDAVSTTAQEAKNPGRDLPIGILGSLVVCTILYILVSLTLTGVVSYKELNVPDPIAVGIDKIVELRGWSTGARTAFTFAVKLGALAGLTSVILVMMLGQTRVFYAMSKDGLLPWFKRTHTTYGTPHIATVVTGVFVALASGALPTDKVGEMVSIGTLLAFVLVCIGTPLLRFTQPEMPRAFRVPGGTFGALAVGAVGAGFCVWLILELPIETQLRLLVWLAVGLVIYFAYGRKHSVLAAANAKKG